MSSLSFISFISFGSDSTPLEPAFVAAAPPPPIMFVLPPTPAAADAIQRSRPPASLLCLHLRQLLSAKHPLPLRNHIRLALESPHHNTSIAPTATVPHNHTSDIFPNHHPHPSRSTSPTLSVPHQTATNVSTVAVPRANRLVSKGSPGMSSHLPDEPHSPEKPTGGGSETSRHPRPPTATILRRSRDHPTTHPPHNHPNHLYTTTSTQPFATHECPHANPASPRDCRSTATADKSSGLALLLGPDCSLSWMFSAARMLSGPTNVAQTHSLLRSGISTLPHTSTSATPHSHHRGRGAGISIEDGTKSEEHSVLRIAPQVCSFPPAPNYGRTNSLRRRMPGHEREGNATFPHRATSRTAECASLRTRVTPYAAHMLPHS